MTKGTFVVSPTSLPARQAAPTCATAPLTGRGSLTLDATKLVVLEGNCEGIERPLSSSVTVGSDPEACDLVLDDRGVSRRHARFGVSAEGVWVEDLGSRNGTYLDGVRIAKGALSVGSVVQIGPTPMALYPRWHVREVEPSRCTRFGELHGTSLAMRQVFALLARVAETNATVLIEGESGTGKELAARSLHQASRRAREPYVVVDCTTVPHELAESELFGHRRGSFTGAALDREGAFQNADGGTLFLDEIGELPPDLQPKLLRALEGGEVRRVGDSQHRNVDVRVVAATNRNLDAEVRRGRFRADLMYRLGVVRVRLPPLRSRPEDIKDIVRHLLGRELADGSDIAGINLERLMGYSWPGNVRELRNVLQRACALSLRSGGQVCFEDLVFNLGLGHAEPATLGFALPGVDAPLPYKEAKERLLSRFEDEYVQALLKRHRGNVTAAAKAAGVSRKHLYALMRKVEIGSPAHH